MSDTDRRIEKLAAKGLSPERIARRLGRPGPEGLARVLRSLGLHPVLCMERDCRKVCGSSEIEGSTGLCDECLEARP